MNLEILMQREDIDNIISYILIKKLVQPGGSKADTDVAERAQQLDVDMVITHKRHFWH